MAVRGARVVTLAISDVPGDALPVIASGPTVFDNSTFEDALNVVRDYKLEVPAEVLAHLQRGVRGEIEDTLKESNPLIKNDVAKVIASSTVACAAGEKHAKNVGFSTIMQGIVEGEAHEVAARMAAEISAFAKTCKEPTVFISGGELTVTLPKNNAGNGGRNSRFMLALLKALQGAKGIHAIACGTDGIDYTTYAGAVIGDDTWNAAQKKNLSADDYLTRFDSHRFFEQIDGLIKTNATHTNVGDYRAILVLPKEG
jgi:hydroxypyruvate reductase